MVLEGGTEVKTSDAVCCPGCACVRGFINEDLGAEGSDGMEVEVERMAVGTGVSRNAGVGCKWAQSVEGDGDLGNEFVPGSKRESRIGAAEGCDHVILCCSPATLGSVGTMIVGWCKLDFINCASKIAVEFM